MNTIITSKEIILSASKELVQEAGMTSLNIREVAKKCDISVGSVYNYFKSKDDLIIATIESIWAEILELEEGDYSKESFETAVKHFFDSALLGSEKYSFFLDAHSMSMMNANKSKGREVMNRFFGKIIRGMVTSLERDPLVKSDAFSEDFTKEAFVGFVFSNIMTLIMNRKTSCDFLLTVIRRTIYIS